MLRGVRELAALRHPAQGRRPRPRPRACARPRPTTGRTSASAAAASRSRAAGPARPSPSTRPTAPPSSGRSWRQPGSRHPTQDRMAADVLTDDGQPRFVWEDVPAADADYIDVVMASVARGSNAGGTEYETAKQPLGRGPRQPEPSTAAAARTCGQPLGNRPDHILRVLPTASQTRSPDWPSRVSEANHAVTRSALDGQAGDLTIQLAGGRGTPATDTGRTMRRGRRTAGGSALDGRGDVVLPRGAGGNTVPVA